MWLHEKRRQLRWYEAYIRPAWEAVMEENEWENRCHNI